MAVTQPSPMNVRTTPVSSTRRVSSILLPTYPIALAKTLTSAAIAPGRLLMKVMMDLMDAQPSQLSSTTCPTTITYAVLTK